MTLLHTIVAGGSHIDHADMLRERATLVAVPGDGAFNVGDVPAGVHAWECPSTRRGDRRVDPVEHGVLVPGVRRLVIDVDSTICEVLGKGKQGTGYGYTRVLGYHPILATRAETGRGAPCPDAHLPVNSGPQHWVLQAALHDLEQWVRTGTAPRSAPRFEVASRVPVVVFRRDSDGNVIGGVRSPQVDAPIATITGEQNSGSSFCSLFGTTTPFPVSRVRQLYPTNAAFAHAWAEAATRAKTHGWLTLDDAMELTTAAATFDPTS